MIAAIIAAEVAFWALLLGGLALRYLARVRRLSSVVLAAVPLVDLALVILVAVDVRRGAEPTRPHAFAALYLGVTIAFGHHIIQRTDTWFRYRFADGPKPFKAPKGSTAEVRAIWHEWLRVVLAAAIAAACLLAMIALEGWRVPTSIDGAAAHPYWATLLLLPIITVVWFLFGPAFVGRGDPTRDPQPDATALRRLAGPAVRLPQGGVARLVRRETGPDGTLPLPHNGQPPSFRQDGPHRVVLITCAGRWLGPASGYESNHIVIAHPF